MTPAACVAARRPSSALRSVARSFEPHPFQRLPMTQRLARPDWGSEARRVATQAALFVPGVAVLLGWPLAAKALLDGHV